MQTEDKIGSVVKTCYFRSHHTLTKKNIIANLKDHFDHKALEHKQTNGTKQVGSDNIKIIQYIFIYVYFILRYIRFL